MPLFYLRPFNFHADKEALRNPKPRLFEFERSDFLMLAVMALLALALFVGFVVIPLIPVVAGLLPF